MEEGDQSLDEAAAARARAAASLPEPAWLGMLRDGALESAEWAEISRLIQSRVRSQLAQLHRDGLAKTGLGLWAELPEEEKDVLLNEIGEEVRNSDAFRLFFERLGGTIDDALLRQENLEFLQSAATAKPPHGRATVDAPAHLAAADGAAAHAAAALPPDVDLRAALEERRPKRHPEVVRLLEIAGDGASALLRRAPGNFNSIRVIGCRGLPTSLRLEVWKQQLRNAAARREFVLASAADRLAVLSKKDAEIAKSCRVVLDGEFDDGRGGGLSEILLACKTILSYVHRRHGGLVASPLRFLAIVLVWALTQANKDKGLPLDDASLVEYMYGLLEETRYRSFFDLSSFGAQPALHQHVAEVTALVQQADASFLALLRSLAPTERDAVMQQEERAAFDARLAMHWQSLGVDAPSHKERERAQLRLTASSPWDLHQGQLKEDASSALAGAVAVPPVSELMVMLVLPLMQRLFGGLLASVNCTCRVWDCVLLLGPQVLPHLCASYLLAARRLAADLLPDVNELAVRARSRMSNAASGGEETVEGEGGEGTASEHGSAMEVMGPTLQEWEWALNASCGRVTILDLQAVFEKYYLPGLRESLHLRETRTSMLAAVLPPGDGKPCNLSAATSQGRDADGSRVLSLGGDADAGGGGGGDATESGAVPTQERGVGGGRGRRRPQVKEEAVQTEGWVDVEDRYAALLQSAQGGEGDAAIADRLLSPRVHAGAERAGEEGPARAGAGATAQQQAPAAAAGAAGAPAAAAAAASKRAAERRAQKAVAEEVVEIWYCGRVYSVIIPDEVMAIVAVIVEQRASLVTHAPAHAEERLSSIADRVLRHPRNQDLLSAVIKLERKLPSLVARVLGNQLRPAMASNVDAPLLAALGDRLPLLRDDYAKPMLRFDLLITMPNTAADQRSAAVSQTKNAQPSPLPSARSAAAGGGAVSDTHQVAVELFVAPLQAGSVVLGTEAVEEAARHAQVLKFLPQQEVARMARLVEVYSRAPPRHSTPRRADQVLAVVPGEEGAHGGATAREAGGAVGTGEGGYAVEVVAIDGPACVGVNIKVERRLEALVADLQRRDVSIVLPGRNIKGGKDGLGEWERAARQLVAARMCGALCGFLEVDDACMEPAGLHSHDAYVLVDVNIHRRAASHAQSKVPRGGQGGKEWGRRRGGAENAVDDSLSALQVGGWIWCECAREPVPACVRVS